MTYRINEFQFQLPASELQDATINILKFPELGTSLIVSRSLLAEGETLHSNFNDQLQRLEKQVQDLRYQPGCGRAFGRSPRSGRHRTAQPVQQGQ
jgi:hypothetical protein